MASQLSADRPRHRDRRSAISGVALLRPCRIRFSVDGATCNLEATSRTLSYSSLRSISRMNSLGSGGSCRGLDVVISFLAWAA